MASICLILSAAALLLNGLTLLGRVPGRDSGVSNVLIGGLQLLLCTAVAISADGSLPALFAITGTFLFGLTYLSVGVDALAGLGSAGLGWFCGLVAVTAVVFAGVYVADDPVLAVLWVGWAVLWSLFFVLLALGRTSIDTYTGWALVLASPVTALVPALLALIGHWPTGPAAAGIAALGEAVVFGGAGALTRRRTRNAATSPAVAPAPAAATSPTAAPAPAATTAS
ncbi:AmiS/UreI family transporter [Curtobacterium sp. CFBP9011]|uniref:AmiS/UreI family transporter n=1 Tax=Curtobacterium sp. CFBP9011 TaxID=3096530 RepID=UPI002A6A9739|nr:AmiS/UreI family transporter [Curtobacterium sp. CFBP9011]MDY1003908.1 AmiS/UreI family transporter [Curtobacterium sp. CFBP9011]